MIEESMESRISLQSPKSLEEVRGLLLKAGWPVDFVEDYLSRTFKELGAGVLLRAYNISKTFGQNKVLENISIDIKPGEIFGIIGVSGAGKTTLLNLLVGFLQPDSGDVVLSLPDGSAVSVFKNPTAVKQMIGFSTQNPSFYPKLTVRENLEHFANLYKIKEPALTRKCNELMDLVGLREARDTIAANLSGGMQKRLDIACALLHNPSILILDEPTADLDPILRKQMWELIRQINARGTTIIIASHFLTEIELLCTRIALLHDKHIVKIGTADQLRELYSKVYKIRFRTLKETYSNILKELSRRRHAFIKAVEENGSLIIDTHSPELLLPILTSQLHKRGEKIIDLQIAKPTLGEIFEETIKNEL